MKPARIVSALLLLSCLLPGANVRASDVPDTSAAAMILYHAPSGAVLAERRADDAMLIASTTKLMTALTVLEHCEADTPILVAPEWTQVEGSSMYLRPNETYTVRELLTGLLLASGNDAALALACGTAGSAEAFAVWMNDKAAELGLRSSRFVNPHGLDAEGHRSCARDLAAIMGAALENDVFREITGKARDTVHGVTYQNHNKLLQLCPGANGGKTGYTRAAGRCLVSSCRRGDLELICVTLHDRDDWADHCALYDWAFDRFMPVNVPRGAVLARIPAAGAGGDAAAVAAESLRLCLPRVCAVSFTADLPRFVYLPVTAGERAGALRVCGDNALLAELPLLWAGEEEEKP